MRRGIGFVSAIAVTLALGFSAAAQTSESGGGFADIALATAPDDPIVVAAGAFITQITSVDQRSENYGAVLRLRLEWQDPALAARTDGEPPLRVYAGDEFVRLARARGLIAPTFIVENQQSRSFLKQNSVVVTPDGRALFTAEMIMTLQAPDFEFTRYPFDTQKFFVRVLANAPETHVRFVPIEGYSGLGNALGEEEWRIRRTWTEVDTVPGITGLDSSRFSLGFESDRHLDYYSARIFLPIALILGLSWANLFLEDYRRRLDIAGANLLSFIAFNFTISNELPRLGYLTFLDGLIMAVFVLTGVLSAYAAILCRMEAAKRDAEAWRLDWHVTFWGYPLALFLALWWLRAAFLS